MLIEFSVENFLSIKDKITLSMVASKDSTHENNLISYKDNKKNLGLLKSAVIYGANASGKTNVLRALSFMRWFLNKSHEMQQGKIITRIPFKLDGSCINEPSKFDIIFRFKDIKYAYGFSVTEEKVIDEYLYYYPNGRQTIIFERWDTNQYKFTNDIELQTELIKKFDSKNKLYISTASLWEYEKTKAPFEWLSQNLQVFINHDHLENYTANVIKQNKDLIVSIQEVLKQADLGIDGINITERKFDDSLKNDLLKFFNDETKLQLINKIESKGMLDISIIHTGLDETGNEAKIPFKFIEESDGTQKFFGLLGPWIDALNNGYTIIIDELDIRLHTLLTRYLVELFHNPDINKSNAQLIFSTHDTNLLNQNIFRRDQIWFTEKKENGSTDLYSLDDFGIRKDEKIEKGYLQGKYGAIPFIGGGSIWD